jgi:hypothetical protein
MTNCWARAVRIDAPAPRIGSADTSRENYLITIA